MARRGRRSRRSGSSERAACGGVCRGFFLLFLPGHGPAPAGEGQRARSHILTVPRRAPRRAGSGRSGSGASCCVGPVRRAPVVCVEGQTACGACVAFAWPARPGSSPRSSVCAVVTWRSPSVDAPASDTARRPKEYSHQPHQRLDPPPLGVAVPSNARSRAKIVKRERLKIGALAVGGRCLPSVCILDSVRRRPKPSSLPQRNPHVWQVLHASSSC